MFDRIQVGSIAWAAFQGQTWNCSCTPCKHRSLKGILLYLLLKEDSQSSSLSKCGPLHLAMLPGRHESRKLLNKQLCTTYCLNKISIRVIWRRVLFFAVLFASNQVNKEVEPQPVSVPWEHISTIISTDQSKRRQSSLLEKHNLFLNVLFLHLMSLAAQLSCYEVAVTIAQAKANHLDSLQFWKTSLSIYEKKNYSRRYVSQKRNSRETMPEGNIQRPQLPSISSLIFRAFFPFFPPKKILSTNFFWGEKADKVQNKWKFQLVLQAPALLPREWRLHILLQQLERASSPKHLEQR